MKTAVTASASERMAAWYSRRSSFALMGEYSSGKSALLNSLLGHPLLPTRVTATDLPAVWITKGAGLRLRGLQQDGSFDDLGLEDLTSGQAMKYLVIRIETEAAILNTVDIIDTPGISDPRMSTAIVEEIARYSDFAIWCSPLNQAWRQTERAFWKAMPDRMKPISILALTRADMMRDAADIGKVVRRCVAEAGPSFGAVHPISAPMAGAALVAPNRGEQLALREASGIVPLLETIGRSVSAAQSLCDARPKLEEPGILVLRKKADKAPAKRTAKQPKVATTGRVPAQVVSVLATLGAGATDFSRNEHISATISHLLNQVVQDKGLSAEHREVLIQALTVGAEFTSNIARVLKQVEHEVEDFADGPWCELGQ